jgi:hypothetical protein
MGGWHHVMLCDVSKFVHRGYVTYVFRVCGGGSRCEGRRDVDVDVE